MTDNSEKYRVTTAALNVREMPSNTSKIVGCLTKNQRVEKLDISSDGNWIQHKTAGLQGWSSKKYLEKLVPLPGSGESFPWMPIAEAEKGVIEIPGSENNPRVLEYLNSVTNIGPTWRSRDETPWCSAFVNWCMEKAGYTGTKSALSTSWLRWGQSISKPVKGCLVIFLRENGGGHVGFYVDETVTSTATYIKVLSGNQEHADTDIGEVNEKHYLKSKLLGYRLPSDYVSPVA
jgi:uncharacterized protein (TIGR02594 family)